MTSFSKCEIIRTSNFWPCAVVQYERNHTTLCFLMLRFHCLSNLMRSFFLIEFLYVHILSVSMNNVSVIFLFFLLCPCVKEMCCTIYDYDVFSDTGNIEEF